MMTTVITIDRGQLLTGAALKARYGGSSTLRCSETGLMCVMGCYLDALNFDRDEFTERCAPSDTGLRKDDPDLQWLFTHIGDRKRVEDLIAEANDNPKLHPVRREAKLKKLFKTYGNIELQFVGSYRPATTLAKRTFQRV